MPGTGRDKVTRAEPFSVQCEAGNVYLVKADWNESYLDELCLFPGGSFTAQWPRQCGRPRAMHVRSNADS
jgi:hypothetical protein